MTIKQLFWLLRWLAFIPLALVWVLFTYFMAGYSFSSLVALLLMAILLFYNLCTLLLPKFPVPVLLARRIFTGILCIGLLVCGVTEILIIKASFGDPKEKAEQGDTVIITTVPDKCYKTGSVIVTDQSGEQIEVTKQEDGTYAFEMPGEKVTVKVNFIIDFIDVNESDYFSAAVDWAVENTITTGTSATMFSPYMICTRAQAVTFLWRAAGSPTPKSSEIPFEDIAAGAYYYHAVLWAV